MAKDVVEKVSRRFKKGPCVLLKEFGFRSFLILFFHVIILQ